LRNSETLRPASYSDIEQSRGIRLLNEASCDLRQMVGTLPHGFAKTLPNAQRHRV
jgi:hypothetical protein